MVFLTTNKKRLAKARDLLATCPFPEEAVEEAFLEFRYEGELPEDERFAAAVCAKAGYRNVPSDPNDIASAITILLARAAERRETQAEAGPTVREVLFDEAIYGPDVVRRWARAALRVLVCRGGDVTNREFGQRARATRVRHRRHARAGLPTEAGEGALRGAGTAAVRPLRRHP
jgi:hypothetical protein